MTQNTSTAVMARRVEPFDSLDYFPTPPWATRALVEYVIGPPDKLETKSVLEPACGEGHMVQPLMEYFAWGEAFDIHEYGYGGVADFLTSEIKGTVFDWIITNPPFKSAEQFILRSLQIAKIGVAMLTRTSFLESVGRYNRIFRGHPPNIVAVFSERVPMIKGRLDSRATTATSYCWLVWRNDVEQSGSTRLMWIPPCRKRLEKKLDYA